MDVEYSASSVKMQNLWEGKNGSKMKHVFLEDEKEKNIHVVVMIFV